MPWMARFFAPTRPSARRSRAPLSLEPLESRLAPATRLVVPYAVPADNVSSFHTVSEALTPAGLAPGDIIQIEPGATPGELAASSLPSVTNLTIQGNPLAEPTALGLLTLSPNFAVGNTADGLTFRNLRLANTSGPLTFNATGTLDRVLFENYNLGTGILITGANDVSILSSTLVNYNTSDDVSTATPLLNVTAATGSRNVIRGNTFLTNIPHTLIGYEASASAAITDVVSDNTLVGPSGDGATTLFLVAGLIDGLTIRGNRFSDPDLANSGVFVGANNQNILIANNTFTFSSTGSSGIFIQGGAAGATTATIVGNSARTGLGTGLVVDTGAGSVSLKVEGNDFNLNAAGVRLSTPASAGLSSVDLGGGGLGSKGGNNFRGYSTASATTGAIVVTSGPTSLIRARGNLFSVLNPSTAIFDKGDSASSGTVDVTATLTGHQAYVQALYTRFLRRAGDVANPADAGYWAQQLTSGLPANVVAASIIRSPEALGLVVDDAYLRILGRPSDPGGRAYYVAQFGLGLTLAAFQNQLFASPEYASRFPSSVGFAASLYTHLLGRAASPPELSAFAAFVNQAGRQNAALAVLNSPEHRGRVVREYYIDLLHRGAAPGAAEVDGWVASGLDLLDVKVAFAASPEFQAKG